MTLLNHHVQFLLLLSPTPQFRQWLSMVLCLAQVSQSDRARLGVHLRGEGPAMGSRGTCRQEGDPLPPPSKATDKMAHWTRHVANKPLAKELREAVLWSF